MCVLGRVVFHMPDWLHHMLSATRILFKQTLEAYMDQYLQYKLDQILQEHRLVSLITLLRGLCLNYEWQWVDDILPLSIVNGLVISFRMHD